ncbi:MAG: hypothetical protein AAGJ80_12370 [Cyanobacteria bacterium J06553_1]
MNLNAMLSEDDSDCEETPTESDGIDEPDVLTSRDQPVVLDHHRLSPNCATGSSSLKWPQWATTASR